MIVLAVFLGSSFEAEVKGRVLAGELEVVQRRSKFRSRWSSVPRWVLRVGVSFHSFMIGVLGAFLIFGFEGAHLKM